MALHELRTYAYQCDGYRVIEDPTLLTECVKQSDPVTVMYLETVSLPAGWYDGRVVVDTGMNRIHIPVTLCSSCQKHVDI